MLEVGMTLLALEVCWWLAVAVFIRGYWSLSKEIKEIPIEYL